MTPRQRGTCPVCRRAVAVTHKRVGGPLTVPVVGPHTHSPGFPCPGHGRIPVNAATEEETPA